MTAVLIDPTEPVDAFGDGSRRGVVSVHLRGLANSSASCSCGWAGRRRILRAAAEQDAWAHSVQDRCEVSCPLVLAW